MYACNRKKDTLFVCEIREQFQFPVEMCMGMTQHATFGDLRMSAR